MSEHMDSWGKILFYSKLCEDSRDTEAIVVNETGYLIFIKNMGTIYLHR